MRTSLRFCGFAVLAFLVLSSGWAYQQSDAPAKQPEKAGDSKKQDPKKPSKVPAKKEPVQVVDEDADKTLLNDPSKLRSRPKPSIKVPLPLALFGESYFLPSRAAIARSLGIDIEELLFQEEGTLKRLPNRRPRLVPQEEVVPVPKIEKGDLEEQLDPKPTSDRDKNLDDEPKEPKNPVDLKVDERPELPQTGLVSLNRTILSALPPLIPEAYTLGPGDKIRASITGRTLKLNTFKLTVDPIGRVPGPGTGRLITVRGLSVPQAERLLQRDAEAGFRNPVLTLELSSLRNISVSILGDAFSQGTFSIPAGTTLFNLIYASGGPSKTGSYRRILLRRNNQTTRTFDLYRLLIIGDSKQDVPLESGDTLVFTPAVIRVKARGEFVRQGIYEMLPSEGLSQLAQYASGIKATGTSQSISVDSVIPGSERQLSDLSIERAKGLKLYDGDTVEVGSVRANNLNTVVIEGAVDQPRTYGLKPKMKVSDLIKAARGLLPNAYLDRADLIRKNGDGSTSMVPLNVSLLGKGGVDPELAAQDKVHIYGQEEVKWLGSSFVEIVGAVQYPEKYELSKGMTVWDLVLRAGGLMPDAAKRAFLQRKKADGGFGELVDIDLNGLQVNDPVKNPVLGAGDKLSILTVNQASLVPDPVVYVYGFVQRPGQYPAAEKLTVNSLLAVSGGVIDANSGRLIVARARAKDGEVPQEYSLTDPALSALVLNPGDVVSVLGIGNVVLRPRLVEIRGRVVHPGTYVIINSGERISDVIKRAGGLLDDAFARGAQFSRDPSKLTTLAQQRLSPRLKEVVGLIQEDDYRRALAQSDIERIRALLGAAATGTGVNVSALGIPAATPTTPNLTGLELPGRTLVTPARSTDQVDTKLGGNLNVDLDKALRQPRSTEDVSVEDGDIVTIPQKPSTVIIDGPGVIVASPVVFQPNRNLGFYLDRASGLTPDSDPENLFLIRPGGGLVRATRSSKVELGDYIFVPTKVMKVKLQSGSNFENLVKGITNTALVFAIIKSVLR